MGRRKARKGLDRLHQRRTMRIGIMALTPSCGTTHLAVAIANYFASKERWSVLYAECAPVEGVIGLRTERTVVRCGVSGFDCDGVEYLPECTAEEARLLLSEKEDVIIVESLFGADGAKDILDRCDRRIGTFSAKPWHYRTLRMNLQQMIRQYDGIVQGDYCSFALTKREEKKLYEEFHLKGMRIPYISDPCRLRRDDLRFLRKFLAV